MKIETLKNLARTSYAKALAALGVVATIATIYSAVHESGPEHNPAFFGRWDSTYEYPVPGGKFTFSGITEFFRNGHYNVNGTFKFSGETGGKEFAAVMPARGVGTWTADDDFLTFTLSGMKTEPGRYKFGDMELPIPTLEQITGRYLPDLNQQYLSGTTGEVKIISQEEGKMVLQGKDPAGNPFTYISSRRDGLLTN
ncbi:MULTISPECIES: hypothetical protein [Pseudomonas]|uniref:Uncharacterized protein n=1 Tax=Pseudomonas putida (strain DOT-T1E) TaxID=1196325 RepID=I7B7G7_PSEPT|nr:MULTISPECIES: hypothetical protein [Pseudomonas]AFO47288.1 hypothetical protein T1E_1433 [Pseudomonas putida DOT-T1E]UZM95251.1 hypothetical protein OPZ46_07460 [Pseudomonas putida DOT-T1E]WPO32161.1 hypothetical protein REH59_11085 [Pseudomonas sp. BO3-4]